MPTLLITGANRGIGLGLTKIYLRNQWQVIATCRNPETAAELKTLEGEYAEKLLIMAIFCDISW